jgi:hypothetical protein
MRCQTIVYNGKPLFIPHCWGGVVHGKHFCTCFCRVKKKEKEQINLMDIINMLHHTFKDCQHFEFGDDFVKLYDTDTKKHYLITIEEITLKPALPAYPEGLKKKAKPDRKTWENIIKKQNAKNNE